MGNGYTCHLVRTEKRFPVFNVIYGKESSGYDASDLEAESWLLASFDHNDRNHDDDRIACESDLGVD